MDRISLYWKNATAEAVGEKHGVTDKELKDLAPRIKALDKQMADDRKAGKLQLPRPPLRRGHDRRGQPRGRALPRPLRGPDRPGHRRQALGNIALQSALNPYTYNLLSDRTPHGPATVRARQCRPRPDQAVVDFITPKIKKTIVNVISKSGETAETASQFILFRDLLQSKLGKKYKDHILATTDPAGGTLREICNEGGYRTLEVPTASAGGSRSCRRSGSSAPACAGSTSKRCSPAPPRWTSGSRTAT